MAGQERFFKEWRDLACDQGRRARRAKERSERMAGRRSWGKEESRRRGKSRKGREERAGEGDGPGGAVIYIFEWHAGGSIETIEVSATSVILRGKTEQVWAGGLRVTQEGDHVGAETRVLTSDGLAADIRFGGLLGQRPSRLNPACGGREAGD